MRNIDTDFPLAGVVAPEEEQLYRKSSLQISVELK